MVSFVVGEAEAGQRADQALAAAAGISRAQARRWIDQERVRLNRAGCRASQRVAEGDLLETDPPEPLPANVEPEPMALAILHEDPDLIVIDKPAGLVVHPAPGHERGTLVHGLLHHCRDLSGIGGVRRPGIVHRLDRGTSGVMVVAKHDASHQALATQFRDHTIEREYRALVLATPGATSGRIERSIGRHTRDRKRMSVRTAAGREARTHWTLAERFPKSGASWLEIRPETGRTHQIRVHLASVGMPIAGDPVYGRAQRRGLELARPALHAAVLGFRHPTSGEPCRFEAALPDDLATLLARLRAREPASESA